MSNEAVDCIKKPVEEVRADADPAPSAIQSQLPKRGNGALAVLFELTQTPN